MGVKNIQATAYNGARTVYKIGFCRVRQYNLFPQKTLYLLRPHKNVGHSGDPKLRIENPSKLLFSVTNFLK